MITIAPMSTAHGIPSPCVLMTPKGPIVAFGTPLHRLQEIHEVASFHPYAGDVRDVLQFWLDKKHPVAPKWTSLVAGKENGDRVKVEPTDVVAVTESILRGVAS